MESPEPDVPLDNPLQVYIREVQRVPPLDTAEENACVEDIRSGSPQAQSAAERLLEANLHLVIAAALRFESDHLDILDRIQEGNTGLSRAIESLSSFRGDSFAAFAQPYIDNAIAEAIRKAKPHRRL